MKRWLWALIVWLSSARALQADDALAKESFAIGAQAAMEGRWEAAEEALTASLAEADNPATRYNLVLVNQALARPLEVLRHAHVFRETPESHAHPVERARAEELARTARDQVAALSVDRLPADTLLTVDGAPPVLRIDHEVYVLPGTHLLSAKAESRPTASALVTLRAGERLEWPRLPAAPLSDASQLPKGPRLTSESPRSSRGTAPDTRASRRARLAWSAGIAGGLALVAAVACYATALRSAEDLENGGYGVPGYPSAFDRYVRIGGAILPLALFGGVAMSAGLLAGPRALQRGSLAWSITSAVIGSALMGVGAALMIQSPERILPEVAATYPSRGGGAVLAGTALPLITYGIGFQLQGARLRR